METNHNEYEDISTERLYERLLKVDPEATRNIHPNNRRRIVRALQLADGGKLKSEQEAGQQHVQIYDSFILGLTMDRELLKKRIDKRFDLMMENGLLEEVTKINDKYSWDDKGLQGIGYKEFRGYFEGTMTLEETAELIKTHTRQFAKRQYTWLNHQMPVHWFDISDTKDTERILNEILEWKNTGGDYR
jgi:tRNA dimethylallyltransferase